MSAQAGPKDPTHYGRYDEDRGYGWGPVRGAAAAASRDPELHRGSAAIGNAHFFVHNTHYIAGSLNTWGWVVLCIGMIQCLVGIGVFVKNQLSRWVGVVTLALDLIAQWLMIPAYPFWSLAIVTLAILAIYGLITYGKRISTLQL